MAGALTRWMFPQVAPRRVAVLRVLVYLFVPLDMLLFTAGVFQHPGNPGGYRPVLVARLLGLPAPTQGVVIAVFALVVIACLVAATGRLPRLAGYAVALGFGYWALMAMSFGKVDHDHLALLVALFALPSVGAVGERTSAEATGWAIRFVQIAVVATYFLSAYAKIRWGGWEWPNGATFQWAVTRRGTFVGHLAEQVPFLFHLGQWGLLIAETLSPVLLFLSGRALYAGVAFFAAFHLITWMSIAIHFLPLVVCLTAFLPLERLRLPGRLGFDRGIRKLGAGKAGAGSVPLG
ncbi:hypothetical protein C1I98_32445 [Spongiactinospora gelatinilytica]|uniref:HTTM domain-containing protein n=1 Tax=Spongiactinospora gelatinilytica TaxID=2666298 RepID=A0A2W2GQB2_9ACTN|nr:HTTM domain-containing protein [Spongiactinospora gelatinilytica]PZG29074.1 hypothetical protein C1I98_32445 [Spongiactinospora gelatinilytica]